MSENQATTPDRTGNSQPAADSQPTGNRQPARSSQPTGNSQAAEFDAIIVGAGFSGLYMLHSLRKLGLSVRAYKAVWCRTPFR